MTPLDTGPLSTRTQLLQEDDLRRGLREDVLAGLRATPKRLAPKWLYDAAGSELFDAITALPEYYPTEAERAALRLAADEIAERSGARTVMELGSGSSDKTRTILDALRPHRYIAFDVSESALDGAAAGLRRRYPGMRVDCVVGDFDQHLAFLPEGADRMLVFLGGTIGNYPPEPRAKLLSAMSATLQPGETLLLGTDLVKDPRRLVRAYDDSAGVTAAFNRNILTILNRELRADFDLDGFEHVALWDTDNEWIEMRLRARRAQHVRVAELDLDVDFAEGEEMHTEVSCKFRREKVEQELDGAGLDLIGWWTDPAEDFGLSLSRKR
ncbi:methyltransferase [Segniliparus rotundus DSM 44985]|uniref:Histidine N-alpha-methyltransferase n=1 Tax=Segniliparus rotundus (strain ATCC BAA-972 / CDC 1076 / CIP 108378 / DSM 44985 / JCM 13578) TaxID=640132 RepID=D6Z7A9_SEGRD|nr:L-histidine N(alpha)-methyltransferase [Segniliparus rotundus]ADG97839.1 methyltransferase [Segniliparus rotundus DSM 44985]